VVYMPLTITGEQAKKGGFVAFGLVENSYRAIALELADQLKEAPSLAKYHLLPSVRGDLLAKFGRCDAAWVMRAWVSVKAGAAPWFKGGWFNCIGKKQQKTNKKETLNKQKESKIPNMSIPSRLT